MMLSKLYLFALLLLVQGIDNEHDRLSKMNKALKEAIKSLIETEVADFGALASLGACPKGKELTETQCRGLKGSQYGSKWAYADEMGGYWAGKETCGCYIDQNGKRYFNRRPTGHKYCGADQGEKMICVIPPPAQKCSSPNPFALLLNEEKGKCSFAVGRYGTAGCPEGYKKISDVAACQAAIQKKSKNIRWRGAYQPPKSNWPIGCVVHKQRSFYEAYWNGRNAVCTSCIKDIANYCILA